MITYIYILVDPLTDEIRYVGKTNNLAKRRTYHFSITVQSKLRCHVSRWLTKILNQGLRPLMIEIDKVEGDWEWCEKYWIEQFKIWGCNLTNHSIGGGGTTGWQPSEEFRKKQSILKMGRKVPQNVINDFIHRIKGNSFTKGEKNRNAKITEIDVVKICEMLNKGVKSVIIAKEIPNCTPNTVGLIKIHKTWKHITKNLLNSTK